MVNVNDRADRIVAIDHDKGVVLHEADDFSGSEYAVHRFNENGECYSGSYTGSVETGRVVFCERILGPGYSVE